MNIRWQSLIFVFVILISIVLTNIDLGSAFTSSSEKQFPKNIPSSDEKVDLSGGSVRPSAEKRNEPSPMRVWSVLDPNINARAVLIQSLEEGFPFLHYNTHKQWPIASVTKLMTAVVALENIGADKKIPVSELAVATEGIAGSLKSGEVYALSDLAKIMLLSSSNDAAAAFEEYLGGRDECARLMNKKARELGMIDTIFNDGVGLSDLNISTASDLLILNKYIIERHPDIFMWTRTNSFLVEPFNDPKTKTVSNIIPFVDTKNFLGGKTGTIEASQENFSGIFLLKDYKVAVIVLGSPDRAKEIPFLLQWVEGAYEFPR